MQDTQQDKARALYAKYKSGAFDSDPAAKEQAAGLLRKLLPAPPQAPMGLPSSAPVPVGGGFGQVDRKEAFDSYGFTDAVRDVGLAPAVVDQIGLGLSNAQHAFGQAVSGAAEVPGRIAALVSGEDYNPKFDAATRPPLTKSMAALGDWIKNAPVQPNTPRTFFSGDLAEGVGGSVPTLAAGVLAGPEAALAMGAAQGMQGGLEQGQNAQAQAEASGQPRPTNAQVAFHTFVTTATGAASGYALGTGVGGGTLAGSTALPAAAMGLQGGLNAESAHEYLGAPEPTASDVLKPAAVGATLGLAGHGVNPHPVGPDTMPPMVDVVSDPAAISKAEIARQDLAKGPDLDAIVDHLRSLTPNTEVGLKQAPADPATRQEYAGPKSAAEMQHALWANDENLRDLAQKHELVSNPTVKRQVRQEIEDTLHRKMSDEDISGIAKWRQWAQDNGDSMKAAIEKQAAPAEAPVSLSQTLPKVEDIQAGEDLQDAWHAERDETRVSARVTAMRHEQELQAILPPESPLESVKRLLSGQRVPQAYSGLHRAILFNIDLRGKADEEYAKYGPQLSAEDQRIFNLSQNLPEGAQKIADQVAMETSEQGDRAIEAGAIEDKHDYYLPRLWVPREEGAIPPDAQGKFPLNSGRFKARSYSSVLEGLADGRELAVQGAFDAQRISAEQTGITIANRKLIQMGLKDGLFGTASDTGAPPEEGWKPIEHPAFTAPDGKQLYAEPARADRLNAILKKSGLNDILGVKTLTALNREFKTGKLLLGFFHHRAMLQAFAYGSKVEVSDVLHPIDTFKDAQNQMLTVDKPLLMKFARRGYTFGGDQDYRDSRVADESRIGSLLNSAFDRMGVVGDAAQKSRDGLMAVVQQQHDFLFNHFMPTLKWLSAKREYMDMMAKNEDALASGKITEEQIIDGIAATHNNRFQSQNLERLNRSATTQHALQLSLLAPDWTEGIVRFAMQPMGVRLAGEGWGIKTIPAFERQLAQRTWGRILVRSAIATGVGNALLGAMDDRSYKQRFQDAYDAGGGGIMGILKGVYDFDVTPIYKALGASDSKIHYMSSLLQYEDPIKALVSPVSKDNPSEPEELSRAARAKLSPLMSIVTNAMAGTDSFGRPYTNAAELTGTDNKGVYPTTGRTQAGSIHIAGQPEGGKLAGQISSNKSEEQHYGLHYSQLPSFGLDALQKGLPIPIVNAWGALRGQEDGIDGAFRSAGIRTSTADMGSIRQREMEEAVRKATSIGERRALEAQLKAFNKTLALKKMQGK